MIWGHFLFRFYTNEKTSRAEASFFRVGREGTLVFKVKNIEK